MISTIRKSKLIAATGLQSLTGESLTLTGGSPFPLSVSANGRFLVTAQNQPFFMVADSCQAGCIESLTDITFYAGQRAAAGFNCIQFGLIMDEYAGGVSSMQTIDGIAPFTGAVFTTPNETYFARQDALIAAIGAAGLFCWINPWQLGGGSTMFNDLTAASNATATSFGNYVANRYKNLPYVGWYFGNDFSGPISQLQSMIQSFINIAPTQLRGGETCTTGGPAGVTAFDNGNFTPPYLQCNGAYTYTGTYSQTLEAYNNSSVTFAGLTGTNTSPTPCPVTFLEGNYEWENQAGDASVPKILRQTFWWYYLSGGSAYVHGSHFTATNFERTTAPVAGFNTTTPVWRNNLNSPAVTALGVLKTLLTSIDWQDLVPDQTHVIGTSGFGTAITSGNIGTNNYITLSATPGGHHAIAYFPQGSSNTLTVAMTFFATSSVLCKWMDPTNGTLTTIGTFANTGTRTFSPTGNNAGGDSDWVLVMAA